MQAIEFRAATRRSQSPVGMPSSADLHRRMECLTALKRACGNFGDVRERNFQHVMAQARADAATGNPSDTAAAALALDLLALELCDD